MFISDLERGEKQEGKTCRLLSIILGRKDLETEQSF